MFLPNVAEVSSEESDSRMHPSSGALHVHLRPVYSNRRRIKISMFIQGESYTGVWVLIEMKGHGKCILDFAGPFCSESPPVRLSAEQYLRLFRMLQQLQEHSSPPLPRRLNALGIGNGNGCGKTADR